MVVARHDRRDLAPVPGARVLVVEARFYDDLADELLRGAMGVLEAAKARVDVLTSRFPPPWPSSSTPPKPRARLTMPL